VGIELSQRDSDKLVSWNGDIIRVMMHRWRRCSVPLGHVRAGDTSGYLVTDLAQDMGIDKANADQLLDAAMETDCPNLTVGADGVARPAR